MGNDTTDADTTRNTGADSLRVGSDASATGDNATAVGEGSVASANNTTALGQDAAAIGENATSIGQGSVARDNATSIGQGAKAIGNNSVAIGKDSEATKDNEVSFGTADNTRQLTNVSSGAGTINVSTSTGSLGGNVVTNVPFADLTNATTTNALTVADAKNMGWVVATPDNNYSAAVKNANTVNFKGSDGVNVKGEANASTGVYDVVFTLSEAGKLTLERMKNDAGTSTGTALKTGKVEVGKDNPNGFVGAQTIADMINGAGWRTNSTTATGGATDKLINAGDYVFFEAGKNMEVTQDVDASGNNVTYTYKTKDVVEFDKVTIGNSTTGTTTTTIDGNGLSIKDSANPNATTTVGIDGTRITGADGKAANYTLDGSTIADGKGNNTTTTAEGTLVEDVNGNFAEYGAKGVKAADVDGNEAIYTAKGSTITDGTNTTTVTAGETKVTDGTNTTTVTAGETKVTDGTNTTTVTAGETKVTDGTNTTTVTAGETKVTDGTNTTTVSNDGTRITGANNATTDYTLAGVKVSDGANSTTTVGKDGLTVKGTNGTTSVGDNGLTITSKDGANSTTLGRDAEGNFTITKDGKDGKDVKVLATTDITGTNSDGKDGKASSANDGSAGSRGLTGQDGLNGKDLSSKVNALRNGEAGTVVYTDAAGNRLVKANDGNYYPADQVKADGSLVDAANAMKVEKTIASLVNPDGNTTTATTLGNIASNIRDGVADNVVISSANATSGVATLLNATTGLSNAATVGDLQAIAQAGLNFTGDNSGVTVHRPLSSTLSVVGEGSWNGANSATDNLYVEANATTNSLTVKMNQNLTGLNSVTVGDATNGTTITKEGTKVVDGNGNSTITTAGGTTVVDGNGNITITSAEGTTVGDANGNFAEYDAKGVKTADVDGNEATYTAKGSTIADAEGNTTITNANGTLVEDKDGNLAGYTSKGMEVADVDGNEATYTAKGSTITDGTNTTIVGNNGVTVEGSNGTAHYGDSGLTITSKDGANSTTLGRDNNGNLVINKDGQEGKTIATTDDVANAKGQVDQVLGNGADGKDGKAGSEADSAGSKGLTAKDGLNGKDLSSKVNALRNGEAGTVVYTDAEGNRLVKANDGNYYPADQVKADGSLVDAATATKVEKPTASIVNQDGSVSTPTALGNLESTVRNGVATDTAIDAANATTAVENLLGNNSTTALNTAATVGDLQSVAQAGLNFTGNDGKAQRSLSGTLAVKGEGNWDGQNSAANNLYVSADQNNGLVVKMNENLSGLNSVTVGTADNGVSITKEGTSVTDGKDTTTTTAAGTTVKSNDANDKSSATYGKAGIKVTAKDGSTAIAVTNVENEDGSTTPTIEFAQDANTGVGTGVITGLKEGVKATDAATKGQLDRVASNFNNQIGDVHNKINRSNREHRAGIAGANAAAGLPQVYMPGKSMVAASAGTYRGQSAVAVGYSRASDSGRVIMKLQGNANTRGDFGGSVGVGFQW